MKRPGTGLCPMRWDELLGLEAKKDFQADELSINLKKVLVITGTRAEYGLLRWVIDGISKSNLLELQLCADWYALITRIWLNFSRN